MDEMIANCYARVYAAAVSCNDDSIIPHAEAQKAVMGMAKVMVLSKHLESSQREAWQQIVLRMVA